jgi:hypothetical protein
MPKLSKERGPTWTLWDEMKFIDGLGSWGHSHLSERELLKRYIEANSLRQASFIPSALEYAREKLEALR